MKKMTSFTTPILILIFNRPDYFKKQLCRLRELRPSMLYIAADGPRTGNQRDEIECAKARALLSMIDWKCVVKTHFAPKNLGCKVAVSSAIDWFFDEVKQGIIIEDDCFADLTFFAYCQELLEKYKHKKEVMHISGFNPISEIMTDTSISFTIHPLCWGWATWRRAWKKYDVDMKDWPKQEKAGLLESTLIRRSSAAYWREIFKKMYRREIDTWDYQWVYAIFREQGLCVLPSINFVTNIGFDQRATHTKLPFSPQSHRRPHSIKFPLQFPKEIINNEVLDAAIELQYEKPLIFKIIQGVRQYFYHQ